MSCLIALLIVASAWRLLKDVAEVLLEATPSHIPIDQLKKEILAVEGILAVHDLHVWSISTGKESLSAHLEVGSLCDRDKVLLEVNKLLAEKFMIDHTTLQIETSEHQNKHFHH